MGGSEPSNAVRTARPVARRRRRPVRWLVVIALAILIGRGAGWIGGGTAGEETADQARLAARTQVPPEPPRNGAGTPEPAAPGTAPAGAGAQPTPPSVPAAESAPKAPAVDGDRFDSLVALVDTRSAEGEFGSAFAALAHLCGLPLDAGQQAAVARSARQLDEAFAAACAAIGAQCGRGEVLAAHDAAKRLVGDHGALLGALLRQARAPFAAAGDVSAVPARDGAMWPQPKVLATDRLVRARLAGAVVTGRVVDSRSDEVTLRVEHGQAVTYPTVRVVHCEPTAATADEAVELGFAALHAGDGLLARLWLAAARSRGAAAATPRAGRLAELLR